MAEPPPQQPSPLPSSIQELILSLEQAIMAAKQLPSTADPTHLLQIQSSLHQAHCHLSAFLARPHLPLPLVPSAENSLSSATAAAAAAEPMQLGEDDDENENDDAGQVSSRGMVDGVEEKMRNCFIKKKRRKRRLSPSLAAAAAEERRFGEEGFGIGAFGDGFDPYATRLRALELVYQFHG